MEDALPQSQPGKFGGCDYAYLFRGDLAYATMLHQWSLA